MPKYLKKIQVLVTEKQYRDLEEIASQQKRKFSTLVREAIEEYHVKKKKEREIAEAVDRLLSLPEVEVPEDYQKWEEEYLKKKYSCK
jgi:rRNA-processing protein FCF1